ncbi:MAG TPA: MFS transporter [Caulobacteraceae bacterium]|nr:MFS transporter [Caulobacteraceae bacterium]
MASEDTPAEAGYPARTYAWTVVAILIATAVISYTDRQVLSLLVDPIRQDLAISDTQFSLLIGAAFAVVYGVTGLPLGWLADRTSRRNLILAGLAVWSLATIGCGLARDFGQIFAARLFVGLGEAVLSPAAISLISDYFPPRRRGVAVGFFLSGIAMGQGAAILIGGAALKAVEAGMLAGTALASLAPWRLVLLLIGLPGLVWSLAILAIREPLRHSDAAPVAPGGAPRLAVWLLAAPILLMVAAASLVDNAMGAWAPSLLIRSFHKDPGEIGVELGLLLTLGFGGGVIVGGFLADRAAAAGGLRAKLGTALVVGLLIAPVALTLNLPRFPIVLAAIPLYFALSGAVTAIGFSSVLDLVPNNARGLAMSISFLLNVAVGASVGPAAVSLAASHVFGERASLGAPLSATVLVGYALAVLAALASLATVRRSPVSPVSPVSPD